jgi:Tfp pilus assembly ATPase PilU
MILSVAEQTDMINLLTLVVECKASDLHIHCGSPPLGRIHGQIVPLQENPLA